MIFIHTEIIIIRVIIFCKLSINWRTPSRVWVFWPFVSHPLIEAFIISQY
jgi:hypothetical protein